MTGTVSEIDRKDIDFMTIEQRVDEANAKVLEILTKGRPVWVDVRPAIEVIPGMTPTTILMPGPPIETARITPPLRTSICGAAMHEGLAGSREEAWAMVKRGEIAVCSSQNYQTGNAACMVTSASMPVIVAEDRIYGGRGYAPLHPGGNPKCLRWGLYDEEVEQDLQWFRDVYGPALGEAVRAAGGVDLITILSKTAGMGDENHNRQPAASMCLALQLIPWLLESESPEKNRIIRHFSANDRFFLHVMMAGVESLTQSCKGIGLSTVMVGMGGNGVEFGIQLAGTGNRWYTTVAPKIHGTFLKPTYTEDDLIGYLGDSCVTEVYGLGGMSAIAGPAYMRLTGSSYGEAKSRTEKARAVSLGVHTFAPVPWEDMAGFPVGVDARKVVGYNILPVSHGGSALRTGGKAVQELRNCPWNALRKAFGGFTPKPEHCLHRKNKERLL